MRTLAFALTLALTVLSAPACQPAPSAAHLCAPGPVVLTVLAPGAPLSAPPTGLFARYDLSGPAQTFTRDDLLALGTLEVSAAYPEGTQARTWSGPRLSEVLGAAGTPGAGARVFAVDGYSVDLDAALIAAHEPILALSADATPLAFGALGPVMLIWPQSRAIGVSPDGDALWPWAVFAIEALPE